MVIDGGKQIEQTGNGPGVDAVAEGREEDEEAQQHHVLDHVRVELPPQPQVHRDLGKRVLA